jgi:serine/threonine-protein kinase
MEISDWQRIESLFHDALNLDAGARGEYLACQCAEDSRLRVEVESLLAAYERRSGFMEATAFDAGMRLMSDEPVSSLTGKTVGSYKILELLGRGGMGEVYLAEDTRLGRHIALKFLTGRFVDDAWAKRQMVKEARAVAMLEHPNICAVHGLEEADGHSFIAMQYVQGETLAALLRGQQRPPIASSRSFAEQIVSALAEAHAHGIIHRDIKPQNVVVTADGRVKVLDFGLAQSVQRKRGGAADESSHLSLTGLVVGTVGYMSPEQLRAERLDFRSDIFSLGTLIYELFAGENPFARESDAEIISAILTSEPPPLRSAAPEVSPELERIVHKCLEKDRAGRYHSANELLYELGTLGQEDNSRPRRRPYTSLPAFAAFVLVIALAGFSAFAYVRLNPVRTTVAGFASEQSALNAGQASAPAVHSLAVLPIANEAAGESTEYLADGLTESLIGKFSALPELRVKAYTSVSGYKDRMTDPQSAGRELDVDAVLSGKIVRQQNLLVLDIRLVRTLDGAQMWAARHPINLADVLSLHDDIARSVTDSMEMRSGWERTLSASRGTASPEAFRQYMLGRYYWKNRDEQNLHKAIGYFNEAITLDPLYAQAHAGLADSYVLLSTVSFGKTPTEEAMLKATAAAKEALALNDNLPEAHTSLGVVSLRYDWDWENAEKEFKRAIELKPDYAPAHYWYSSLLIITGRREEAVAASETARRLDPFSPPAVMNVCRTLSLSRQYDRAIACYDKLIAERPDYAHAQYLRGLVYQRSGRNKEALEIFQGLYAKNKALAGAALGYAYGKAGRMEEARRILAEMEALSKRRYVPAQEFAIIYIGLGDNDNAFLWLEKAYRERFPTLAYLTVDPIFSGLHSDTRYNALVQRLKLSPPTS